jgi:diaminopimelate epimerase
MEAKMRIKFSKLTAAGNDFVLIDNRNAVINKDIYQSLAVKLCNRRYGIGGDGLLFVEKSPNQNIDFKMKYLNSDGSFADMCGNGGRAIAMFAYSIGAAKEKMTFETDAGIVSAEILSEREVKLNMFDPKDLKCGVKTTLDGRDFDIDFINTGVPHAVVFVNGIENFDVFK